MFLISFQVELLLNQLNENSTVSDSLWFILLTAIVLPVLMWLFSPKDLKNKLKDIITHNRVKSDGLNESIKKLHLGIANERQLLINEFVKKYRYVFFPVVPNNTPNIIHITFINAIKGLEKLGLHVYVFIFDDYFCRVKGYHTKEKKTYITNFVKSLRSMGIHKHQILFESDYIEKGKKSKKVISSIYNVTSKLNIEEYNNLSVVNDHYLENKHEYIRKFKSILNMAYPSCVSSKIGFVLSGKDEKKLWETYANKIDNSIVHLYIDALYTTTGELSNVLDKNILSSEDSLDEIKEKVENLLNNDKAYNENFSIFYLFNHNYFIYNKVISFCQKDGNSLEISTINALIDYCKSQLNEGGIKNETINSISEIIYNIFHPKKGD